MIQVQRLESVMGADAVPRGLARELRAERGLLSGVSAGLVSGDDKRVVGFAGDSEEIGHGRDGVALLDLERVIQALRSAFRKAKTRKISDLTLSKKSTTDKRDGRR